MISDILNILLAVLIIYILIGIGIMFILLQTPYADNPIWAMILLWPLYLAQGL